MAIKITIIETCEKKKKIELEYDGETGSPDSLAHELLGTTILNGCSPIGDIESHQSSSTFRLTDVDLNIEQIDTQ